MIFIYNLKKNSLKKLIKILVHDYYSSVKVFKKFFHKTPSLALDQLFHATPKYLKKFFSSSLNLKELYLNLR